MHVAEVIPSRLWVGPRAAVGEMLAAGVRAFVCCLDRDLPDYESLLHDATSRGGPLKVHWCPMTDDAHYRIHDGVPAAVDFLASIVDGSDDEPVYVHCVAGSSRAPAVVAAYLISRRGCTLSGALRVMPHSRPNPSFIAQLMELEEACTGKPSTFDVSAHHRSSLRALFRDVPPEAVDEALQRCGGDVVEARDILRRESVQRLDLEHTLISAMAAVVDSSCVSRQEVEEAYRRHGRRRDPALVELLGLKKVREDESVGTVDR